MKLILRKDYNYTHPAVIFWGKKLQLGWRGNMIMSFCWTNSYYLSIGWQHYTIMHLHKLFF